jgi:hypothetical protein
MIPTINRLPTDYEREVYRQLRNQQLKNIALQTIISITLWSIFAGILYVFKT